MRQLATHIGRWTANGSVTRYSCPQTARFKPSLSSGTRESRGEHWRSPGPSKVPPTVKQGPFLEPNISQHRGHLQHSTCLQGFSHDPAGRV